MGDTDTWIVQSHQSCREAVAGSGGGRVSACTSVAHREGGGVRGDY
jgi:hypothetical protein